MCITSNTIISPHAFSVGFLYTKKYFGKIVYTGLCIVFYKRFACGGRVVAGSNTSVSF